MSQKELFYQWNAAMKSQDYWPDFIKDHVLTRGFDVSVEPNTFIIQHLDDPDFGVFYIQATRMDYSGDQREYLPVFTITSGTSTSREVEVHGEWALLQWWVSTLLEWLASDLNY